MEDLDLGPNYYCVMRTFNQGLADCEGHATARQYLSSLGLGHCHPSQASIATPIQFQDLVSWLSSQKVNTYPF